MLASFLGNCGHGRAVNILRNLLALCQNLLSCLLLLSLLLLGNDFTALIVDIFGEGSAIMLWRLVRAVVLLSLGLMHLLEAAAHMQLLIAIL